MKTWFFVWFEILLKSRRFSQPFRHHVPSLIPAKAVPAPRKVHPVNVKLDESTSNQNSGFRSLGTIRQKKVSARKIVIMIQSYNL